METERDMAGQMIAVAPVQVETPEWGHAAEESPDSTGRGGG